MADMSDEFRRKRKLTISDWEGGYGVRFPRLTFPAAKPVRSSALSQFTAPQSQLEGKGEELRASGF